jgi:hypothetical protein
MLQPRNTASDVWSLGCIYLEIAVRYKSLVRMFQQC